MAKVPSNETQRPQTIHSKECRSRIAKELEQAEGGRVRLKRQKDREEDVWTKAIEIEERKLERQQRTQQETE